MALSSSPRKVIPLSTGDELRSLHEKPFSVTKRVFFCSVIVEGSESGRRLPDGEQAYSTTFCLIQFMFLEIEELVLSLGDVLTSDSNNNLLAQSTESAYAEPVRRISFFQAPHPFNL
jgi:protein ECT2